MEKDKNKIVSRTLYTPQGVHLRAAAEGEEESRTIEGYAILFNSESLPLWKDEDSEAREVIDPSAITMELLNQCDIKMTMFHDDHLILGRSKNGEGTLTYGIDEKGVSFSFDAPHTADGDKALELVKRGDIDGCSFKFTTRYWDSDFVERTETQSGAGPVMVVYRVKHFTGIYDFTLTPNPAYDQTSVEARELCEALREAPQDKEKMRHQLEEMKRSMRMKL